MQTHKHGDVVKVVRSSRPELQSEQSLLVDDAELLTLNDELDRPLPCQRFQRRQHIEGNPIRGAEPDGEDPLPTVEVPLEGIASAEPSLDTVFPEPPTGFGRRLSRQGG